MRLMLPCICAIDEYSCASIHSMTSARTRARWRIPCCSKADVSMATRAAIDYGLALAGLVPYFTVVVSAEDVTACKPDPYCYAKALGLLNARRGRAQVLPVSPAECLVVEDAPPGIRSARSACMRTLGVTNTVPERALREAGADVVTRSLADWTPDAVHHVFDTEWGRQ